MGPRFAVAEWPGKWRSGNSFDRPFLWIPAGGMSDFEDAANLLHSLAISLPSSAANGGFFRVANFRAAAAATVI
jgi:hypothetical protein